MDVRNLTTLDALPGHSISKSLGLVSVNGGIKVFTNGDSIARSYRELAEQAEALGANAVVGIVPSLSVGTSPMILLVGTAVVVEPEPS